MSDSHSPNTSEFDSRRLRELTAALCDDTLSAADQNELQQTLISTEAARTQFLEDMCVHAGLEWETAANGKLKSLIESCRDSVSGGWQLGLMAPTPAPTETALRKTVPRLLYWAVAAALLVAGAALIMPNARDNSERSDHRALAARDGSQRSQPTDTKAAVATISPASDDCRWMFEKRSMAEKANGDDRSKVHSGETLRVTSGTLQLTFEHGTAATLRAPALVEIISPMRGRLIRGRVTVKVAEGSQGFTIDTPRTSVVDLGTIFGVEVDDIGRTDVVVFSGIVDVTYTSDVQHSASAEVGKQRLYMGEAMRVDDRGTLSRIISLKSNRFAADRTGSAAPSRPPIIATVRDNIKREKAWNFYEIVPEGMREDAKAFVDRLHHEWNGVDKKGIPGYLLGGDYVKTFNDDKNAGDIELFVKLSQPATLYVLWCKRIPPPTWLREEFEDTGDQIGVDEGRHVFGDGTVHNRDGPGVGPGVSIDSIHSIWRRRVTKPGTVRLGPTETPGWDLNMYGIVAVPLK
jgi:FecR-like protein